MRDEDFDFAAFAGSLLDAVIFADDAGRITYVNPAAQAMFGYTLGGLVSQDLAILMPERFRADHHRGLERIRSGSKPIHRGKPLDLTGLRQNGDEFPIELSLSSWRSERGYIFSGVIRDVSDRRRSERREKTQVAVTRLIADSSSLMEAVTRVIETICASMDWELGVMWVHDPRTDTLHCAHFWDSQAPRRSAFERATVEAQFARGEGLPGRVWATGTSEWLENISSSSEYARSVTAAELGLRTALAFPILNSKEAVVGVLDFTTRDRRQPDAPLLEMVDSIGRQIGTLLERAYSTEAVHSTVEQMQVGVLVFQLEIPSDDRSFRLISANPAASDILQIPSDQMIGRLIDENFPNLRARGIPEIYLRVIETQHSIELEDITYNDARVALGAYAIKAFPLPNRCVGVAFENITKRKSAEQLIRAERNVLEEIALRSSIKPRRSRTSPMICRCY